MRRVLSMMAMAALVWGPMALAQQPEEKNPVVLKVNGEPVYAAEISMAMGNLASQAQRMGQQPNQDQLIQMATGRVVDSKLLAQEARRQGLKPNEERVQQSISQIEQQAGGADKFASTLASGGMTVEQFTNMLREMDLAQELVNQKIKPGVTVTEADARKWYDENPSAFERPEQVHARHILIKVAPDADEAAKKAALDKAAKARARALKGEDFAELAKELSEGPSAKDGGDLGFFTKDRMVKPFADAAFALEPGQISDVVETRFGYHVIKVEERRPASKQPFEEVKDRLTGFLGQQKLGEAVQTELKKLRDKAKIEEVGGEAGTAPAAEK